MRRTTCRACEICNKHNITKVECGALEVGVEP